jgi:pimeloyl-ACP methyl ester carboxylesterase
MSTGRAILQFSHANGFPAPVYRVFLDVLATRFDVRSVERFGHDPRHPVTDGWHHLADELVEAIETHGRPVIAVGHSLGGYLSLMAAVRRPDLVRGIVMLDAPLISRWLGGAIAFTKRIGAMDRFTPAPGTRHRRRVWASAREAGDHFTTKSVFRRFDPRCLRDYVTHGTQPDPAGVCLRFDPEIEYRIYRTLPHDLVRSAARLAVPGGVILGAASEIARRTGTATSRRHLAVATTPGGHLFPLQNPEAAGHAVLRMIGELGLR